MNLRWRRLMLAALLVVSGVVWLNINGPVEGRTLFVIAPGKGITQADLLSVAAFLAAVWMLLQTVLPGRREAAGHRGFQLVAAAGLIAGGVWWLLANGRFSGRILVSLPGGHGVKEPDILSLAAFAAAVIMTVGSTRRGRNSS